MSQKKLEAILKRIADVEGVKNYEIIVHEDPLRGNGFLSEFYTGSVKNKETGELIQTYIKKMPIADPGSYGPNAFHNEHHFYLNILPELMKFQKDKGVKTPFTHIPRFYCAGNEPGEEYICMENLQIQNFVLLDKSQPIDKPILKAIFEKYGKYHALTFSLKDQNFEKYTELVSPLKDMYVGFGSNDKYLQVLKDTFGAVHNGLKDINMKIAKHVEPFVENITEHYRKIMVYNGQFSGLVHGDCWSNNMLFKFRENGTIEDVKFVDFQLCRESTPIHDLSYFFYSGASKEDFEKLDEYLELYHKSFSAFARELGSDPEKLVPLDALKSEWKKHSLLGIIMGTLLWTVKLMHKDDIEEVTTGQSKAVRESVDKILESNTFKENTSAILIHAVESGIL